MVAAGGLMMAGGAFKLVDVVATAFALERRRLLGVGPPRSSRLTWCSTDIPEVPVCACVTGEEEQTNEQGEGMVGGTSTTASANVLPGWMNDEQTGAMDVVAGVVDGTLGGRPSLFGGGVLTFRDEWKSVRIDRVSYQVWKSLLNRQNNSKL